MLLKRLMLVLGNPKLKDFNFKNTKTVLILTADKLGDSVLTIPAIMELKENRPGISVYIMFKKHVYSVFEGSSYIDKLFPYSIWSFIKLRNKIDVFADLTEPIRVKNFFCCRVLNPKKVITYPREPKYGLTEKDFSYYKDHKPADPQKHICDIISERILSGFGLKIKERKYDLYVPEKDLKTAEEFWKEGKKRILLNIRGINRMLDKDAVISVVNNLRKDFKNLDIVVPWHEKTKDEAAALASAISGRLSFKTNIKQLFALVKSADIIISVDTGIVHIAAAFNKNIVAFHEKAKLVWRPLNTTSSVIVCDIKMINKGMKLYSFNAEEAENIIRKHLAG